MKTFVAHSRQFVIRSAWTLCFVGICAVGVGTCVSLPAYAQEEDTETRVEQDESILNESPFDLMKIKDAVGGEEVKLLPIEFPAGVNIEDPSKNDPREELIVSLVKHPDRRYSVKWNNIEFIKTFQTLVLEETQRLIREKDYARAFEYLDYLKVNYPDVKDLDDTRRDFIFASARDLLQRKQLTHSLAVLESLQAEFPSFQRSAVREQISRSADELVAKYYDEGNLVAAQKLLERLKRDYQSPSLKVVDSWNDRFLAEAEQLKAKAEQARNRKDYRVARDYASDMLALYPTIPGGQELLNRLIQEYPMIRVAVFQTSDDYDSTSLTDWAARRSGNLVSEPLFGFQKTGPAGGQYEFAYGNFEQSANLKELELVFKDKVLTGSPHDVAQWLLRRANPDNEEYLPSWAELLDRVESPTSNSLVVYLRRPHVLPNALMQWQLRDMFDEGLDLSVGSYDIGKSDSGETSFKLTDKGTPLPGQAIEIIEIAYDDPQQAVSDLASGAIEVIDQLYPSDVKRLTEFEGATVGTYMLPTVHMLVPVSDHAFLAEPEFRRALLYAVNRKSLLERELLGNIASKGSQLISGPFPIGLNDNDPLSYAYNKDIPPFEFDPRLAKLLTLLTEKKLQDKAAKNFEEAPVFEPIRLGVPNFEAAKIAGEACVQQWGIVDIPAELVVLESGVTEESLQSIDLLYVSAAIWEPVTDVERLFGEGGIAETNDSFIVQAIVKLRNAKNWGEASVALKNLHQLINTHVPILPLWQITDSFAWSKNMNGIARDRMSLYQNLNRWRITTK